MTGVQTCALPICHPIHAEWSWNMHDNSVVCINNAARKLIGETNPTTAAANGGDDVPDDAIPSSISLPGDSARSARIEQTVAAWGQPHNAPADTPAAQRPAPAIDVPLPQQPQEPKDAAQQAPSSPAQSDDASPAAAGDVAHDVAHDDAAHDETHHDGPKPERRTDRHRPPVPSWDEIMFGKPKA